MSPQDDSLLRCPCCGQPTITEVGAYEICHLCKWEDDPVHSTDPYYPGGANQNSLLQARDAWRKQVRNVRSNQDQDDLRPLRIEEESLIRALLGHVSGGEQLLHQLAGAQVRDMDDGGMGGLGFAGNEPRWLGSCLVEAEYVDCDGVSVRIALNADQNRRLYELDIWKLDFAPLLEYPAVERVTVKA
ncbi:DUF6984 family protein [Pseudoduganella sp. GCM10020061]|uniref:DUF6984 family protein n=1 Tax=Pseudoduganella sp. GCM10020061 TaxID=3317345 RepID=UPI003626B44A